MPGEASIQMIPPPERVWALVSDVTRMGEWSPACYRCRWLSGDKPTVGARFRGYNRRGLARWSTVCEITSADPECEFAFKVVDGTFSVGYRDRDLTKWRYTFEPDGIGTKVTESFEIVSLPPLVRVIWPFIKGDDRVGGMQETLRRLKDAAEH